MAAAPSLPVVHARLDQLRPHPGNPRKIAKSRLEDLKRTLEAERGMLDARPLIALPDGTVIAGNQRLAAARELGWETIPTVYADLDEVQQRRWMLLDNRPFGEDVPEQVAQMLADLVEAGSEVTLTGYTSAETDRMLRELTKPKADPDDAPPAPRSAKSKPGEVYGVGCSRRVDGPSRPRRPHRRPVAG